MKPAVVDVVELPPEFATLAERRCANIFRQSMMDSKPGRLEMLIRSCYLQGVQDGYDAAQHKRKMAESAWVEPACQKAPG